MSNHKPRVETQFCPSDQGYCRVFDVLICVGVMIHFINVVFLSALIYAEIVVLLTLLTKFL